MLSDYRELLSILNAHRVKYLVIGAYAVAIHAQPRNERPRHSGKSGYRKCEGSVRGFGRIRRAAKLAPRSLSSFPGALVFVEQLTQ
jgi:hypothetical protein